MAEQVEGLRIGAVGSRLVEHLHLFAAADHHGVLGRPLPVLRIRVGCVLVRRPGNEVLQTINTMAAGMGTIMAQVLHSGWSLAMIARASLVGIDHILFFKSLDCLPASLTGPAFLSLQCAFGDLPRARAVMLQRNRSD